jgi:hypothetical protein
MAPSAERREVPITNAGRGERVRQRIDIELWIGTRARDRPHINQQIDRGLLQQRDELGQRAGRMTDGKDRGAGVATGCDGAQASAVWYSASSLPQARSASGLL